MKRRLFLKTGSVGLGGMIAMPTVIYGCSTLHSLQPQGPSLSVNLFQDGSRSFDLAIAELRLSGSGLLVAAEAEDPDLSGVAEQVALGESAIPAELDSGFTQSSSEMLEAAESLSESAPELFPLSKGMQAELADDFALLKVVKASTLLAGAAKATPRPLAKIGASNKMILSAEIVHNAVNAQSESELIEGTGELLAFSEEYVGSCERYAAELGFIGGETNFQESIAELKSGNLTVGVSELLTSADDMALAAEYYVQGINNLNAEAKYFGARGSDLITSAEELVPSAAELVKTMPQFISAARGIAAEEGAAEMMHGASEVYAESLGHDVENLGLGAEVLDIGGDRFIGGEITITSAEAYDLTSGLYLRAAENFGRTRNKLAEAEHIEGLSEILYPTSENFFYGCEALQNIEFTEGVSSLVNAAEDMLEGAEYLQIEAEYNNSSIEIAGTNLMVDGANAAVKGAELSVEFPTDYLEAGAHLIEVGTNTIMNGAAEFVDGYL